MVAAARAKSPAPKGKAKAKAGPCRLLHASIPGGPAAAGTVQQPTDRYWIWDSGCGHDIVCGKTLTPGQKKRKRAADEALTFETANNLAYTEEQVDLQIPALGEIDFQASPYVLPDCPNVLSMGARCHVCGFGQFWQPYKNGCWLIPPEAPLPVIPIGAEKQYIWLQAYDNVPYLKDTHNKEMPQPRATHSSSAVARGNSGCLTCGHAAAGTDPLAAHVWETASGPTAAGTYDPSFESEESDGPPPLIDSSEDDVFDEEASPGSIDRSSSKL